MPLEPIYSQRKVTVIFRILITNVVTVLRAKGRPEINIKRPPTVYMISKEIGIFIVS